MSRVAAAALAALSMGLCTPVRAAPVWVQDDVATCCAGNLGWIGGQVLVMADFSVAAPATVRSYTVWMSDGPPNAHNGDGIANGLFNSFSGRLSWYVFDDAGGAPGALWASGNTTPAVVDTGVDASTFYVDDVFRLSALLGSAVELPAAGRYWFGVREGDVGAAEDGTRIRWMGSEANQGAGTYMWGDGVGLQNLLGPGDDPAFVLDDGTGGGAVPLPGTLAMGVCGLWGVGCTRVRRPRPARRERPARPASPPA